MLSKTVEVSIVIITYNHEKYIRQAIESVLSQKYAGPLEILIGDDCSSDRTPQILKEYQEIYPDIISVDFRKKNIGASRNIYNLMEKAQGDYIALLEGDDYWTSDEKLTKQIEFLKANSDFSACTHDCVIVDEKGGKLKKQKKIWLKSKKIFSLKDSKGFYLSGQTGTLLFRNFFKDFSHDYSIIYKAHQLISDRTIQMILAAIGPIYHLSDEMSAYRYSTSVFGNNATSVMFVENPQSSYENFIMTVLLENYVFREFNKKISCESTKRMFFSVALVKAILKPSVSNWGAVYSIINVIGVKSIQYIILFPYDVLKRLLTRIEEGI